MMGIYNGNNMSKLSGFMASEEAMLTRIAQKQMRLL